MGGLDRIATLVKAIRAERPANACCSTVATPGPTAGTSYKTQGQDMVDVMNLLQPDAITGHWEFTLGDARVKEIVDALPFAFLAQNVLESEFEDRVFPAQKSFEWWAAPRWPSSVRRFPSRRSPIHAG